MRRTTSACGSLIRRLDVTIDANVVVAEDATTGHVSSQRAGHVPGGRVFGYDNFRGRWHVERRINEPQAAVVRQIFALCAAGTGRPGSRNR